MKATGIVRRIDDLGRVVVPKEIRRTLRIREGDPLEIFTDREGQVILKKYSPIGELNEFATEYCEALHDNTNYTAIISDRDTIIAISGGSRKEYLEKRISPELEKIIESRKTFITGDGNESIKIFYEDEEPEKYTAQVITPIVMQGDPIGSITLLTKEESQTMGELEIILLETAAKFLSKQMEH
ncbi:stage V sporulation protein T [Wansuia hejianensis]|uniref:Stage V sporulation protein T n=1 Tax=Wansuia hejianensis TaxID=2763667 RepID=A0A926EYC8_9FIRM|nr:stage V sporulation protein T [Wansuia hejianensis]MBC8591236.1 stage V sporulation protein T [Wansuia hejianensis]